MINHSRKTPTRTEWAAFWVEAFKGLDTKGGSPADYPTQEAALQHVEDDFERTSERLGSMKSLIFEPKGK